MPFKSFIALSFIALLAATAAPVAAQAADKPSSFKKELFDIKTEWANIKYGAEDKDAKLKSLETLETRAGDLIAAHPDRAEPKTALATILSTEANIIHGLSALPKLKKAKALLEESISIDAKAESGGAHVILGALYAQVPGWPIAFGDSKKAANHLEAALAIDSKNVDANYFYGEFLAEQKKYEEAAGYLQKAIDAPARTGQSAADTGRKAEAKALMAKIEKDAGKQDNKKQYN